MQCSSCEADNPETAKFCSACGAELPLRCTSCGQLNRPGSRFCNQCGAAFVAKRALPPLLGIAVGQAVDSGFVPEGERKLVTALFVDIINSTGLEQDLDPEEARAIIDPALRLMIDSVHRYDGHVVQSTGDGIFALFGAPVAHEDHPQRSLYAALRIQEDTRRLNDNSVGFSFHSQSDSELPRHFGLPQSYVTNERTLRATSRSLFVRGDYRVAAHSAHTPICTKIRSGADAGLRGITCYMVRPKRASYIGISQQWRA